MPNHALIERTKHLAVLQEAMDDLGYTILLEGEAGIGKTALAHAFIASLGDTVMILQGMCEPLSNARPLGPLFDFAGALDPALAEALHDELPPNRLFPMFSNSLRSAGNRVVILIEDIHWADEATLDFIVYLGRRIRSLPCLLLLSSRSEGLTANMHLARAISALPVASTSRLTLEALSREGVAAMTADEGYDIETLYNVTGGNPFYISEIVAGETGFRQVPPSVRDAVWARATALRPGSLEVLQALSLSPRAMEMDVLSRVLERDVANALSECERLGHVKTTSDRRFQFRHEIARLAVLDRVPGAVQQILHKKYSEVLDPGRYLPQIVHHAYAAGDADRVLELAPKAARQASRLGSHRQAAGQLRLALDASGDIPDDQRAQLLEDWSYEHALVQIDDESIAARREAIVLWRKLDRPENVGRNQRWLSRLLWYRGEADEAWRLAEEAVEMLERHGNSHELGMAYSTRSQYFMLHEHTDDALAWGRKALEVATSLDDVEVRIHALNNMGTAWLLDGREERRGLDWLEESLELALERDLHEHAARVYTNLSEYAVLARRFDLADRTLQRGIAFDTRHDLDSWLHYLIGCQAQLQVEKGEFGRAVRIADGVLARDDLTVVMRLPSLLAGGLGAMRLGEARGVAMLEEALLHGLNTGEPQRFVPARLALIEARWLAGENDAAKEHLSALSTLDWNASRSWDRGRYLVWCRRLGMTPSGTDADLPEPYALELKGSPIEAAKAFDALHQPYEAALVRIAARDFKHLDEVARDLRRMIAEPAQRIVRALAAEKDIRLPRIRTASSYSTARNNPAGLTRREQHVLMLLGEGKTNRDMADHLSRSPRTIEHHVSSVLDKLGVGSRVEAMLRFQKEPWLVDTDISTN